jgi:hypothetical protein
MLHATGQRKRIHPLRPTAQSRRGAVARIHEDMSIFEALQASPDARMVFETHPQPVVEDPIRLDIHPS